jgi:membrane-bound serine protease (ClpP class)
MDWILITLILGVLLVSAEVFVPGGILGLTGGLILTGSSYLVFSNYGAHAGFYYLMTVLLLTGLGVYLTSKLVPRSRLMRSLFLSSSESGYSSTGTDLGFLKGREGIALTLLRPAGKALIDGKRIDVVTEGALVAKGTRVKVLIVEGARVVVRALEPTGTNGGHDNV